MAPRVTLLILFLTEVKCTVTYRKAVRGYTAPAVKILKLWIRCWKARMRRGSSSSSAPPDVWLIARRPALCQVDLVLYSFILKSAINLSNFCPTSFEMKPYSWFNLLRLFFFLETFWVYWTIILNSGKCQPIGLICGHFVCHLVVTKANYTPMYSYDGSNPQ